ncbi:unnamed protein product [Symbiodinium natans]|uniref:Uncharacterized protein n=1 Tax=Symbiodinium natans TaxID=878477 RepID=A0A812JYC0_9DINO|nr:unnamed protein product [Symbiodinium natans]
MPTAKPTNIDAQRILAIMDELKEKLTFLSFVSPQVLAGLQGEDGSATVEILGPELMKCFAEQLRLEDLYVMASNGEGGGQAGLFAFLASGACRLGEKQELDCRSATGCLAAALGAARAGLRCASVHVEDAHFLVAAAYISTPSTVITGLAETA